MMHGHTSLNFISLEDYRIVKANLYNFERTANSCTHNNDKIILKLVLTITIIGRLMHSIVYNSKVKIYVVQ